MNNNLFDKMSYCENNNVKVKKPRTVELIQLLAIKDFSSKEF